MERIVGRLAGAQVIKSLQSVTLFTLTLWTLMLAGCGGGGGGGSDDAPADPGLAPNPDPIIGSTYALNSDALVMRCTDGSIASGGHINFYAEVDVAGESLTLTREFTPQIPGFVLDSQSPLTGSVAEDGSFSASGWAILRAVGLPEQVSVNYNLEGVLLSSGWSGTYASDLMMPNGVTCEGEAAFDGTRGRPANLGGIWQGTITLPGENSVPAFGFATENGELRFATDDGEQTVGSFTLTGDDIRAVMFAYAPESDTYPNGATIQPLNGTGKMRPRSTLSGSAGYDGVITSVFNFRYNPVYERLSSRAIIAGPYSPNSDLYGGEHMVIDQGGTLSGANAEGCTYTGQVSIINTNRNLYRLNVTVGGCGTKDGAYSGLAALTDQGGTGNDTLAYSITGARWILSGTIPRHVSSPPPPPEPPIEPEPPTPPTPEPPTPQPPSYPVVDNDGNEDFVNARAVNQRDTITDSLTSAEDADYFRFTAGATGTYTVSLEFERSDVYLYLYRDNPAKTLLGESRLGGVTTQVIEEVQLQANEVYNLGVQAKAQREDQAYRLTVRRQGVSGDHLVEGGLVDYDVEGALTAAGTVQIEDASIGCLIVTPDSDITIESGNIGTAVSSGSCSVFSVRLDDPPARIAIRGGNIGESWFYGATLNISGGTIESIGLENSYTTITGGEIGSFSKLSRDTHISGGHFTERLQLAGGGTGRTTITGGRFDDGFYFNQQEGSNLEFYGQLSLTLQSQNSETSFYRIAGRLAEGDEIDTVIECRNYALFDQSDVACEHIYILP